MTMLRYNLDIQGGSIFLFSRSVGRTQMNEQSSRSHMVFTLRISGINEVNILPLSAFFMLNLLITLFLLYTDISFLWFCKGSEQQVQGVLNLIDLAGSERLSKSGATGDRLKETQVFTYNLIFPFHKLFLNVITLTSFNKTRPLTRAYPV